MIDLSDRHILVFGGSRGIGAAIAKAVAGAGATVSVNYTCCKEAAVSICKDIRASGGTAKPFRGNIANPEEVRHVIAESTSKFGPLHGMAISSGILSIDGFEQTSDFTWEKIISVNLTGSFFAVREFARQHDGNQPASIVVISSTAGQSGGGDAPAYCVSKAGQINLVRCAAKALADKRIRVNCIAPAWTETDMADPHLERLGREEVAATFPLGRIGLPDDVAGPACFLLSDLAGFVTGITLTVDGGKSILG